MVFEGKNGIELELNIKNRLDNSIVNDLALNHFTDKISPRFYWDDGKPEYPSNPYSNLGDLEQELVDVITEAYDIAEKNNWNIIMLGTDLDYPSFSSAHIHQSISKNPTEEEIRYIREHLASIQSFIALLGQNSSILEGIITYCKDARLGYSLWSKFTPYNSNSTSHYLSLASGLSGHSKVPTLEVRIPSSSCLLEQLFANVILVRTFSRLPKVPILPLSETRNTFYKVIRYGGEALIPILNPNGVGYLGIKGKTIYVRISELFKILLQDSLIKDLVKESLSELSSSLRSRITELFELITKGYTVTDLIEETFLSNPKINYLEGKLHLALYNSYSNKDSFTNVLHIPKEKKLQMFVPNITLEELNEMIKKKNMEFLESYIVEDIERIVEDNDSYSIKNSIMTKEIIYTLIKNKKLKNLNKYLTSYKPNIEYCIKNKLLTEDFKIGKNFLAVVQLAKERGYL
jgi:hypothetical protein